MKRKIIIIAMAALLVVGTVSTAFSDNQEDRAGKVKAGMNRGSRMKNRGLAKLDLTKEQLEKIKSLRADFNKEIVPLRNKLELKSLELRHLWTAEELNEESIMAKSREVSDLRSQLKEKTIRHRLNTVKILTKEQRIKFLAPGRRGGSPGMDRGRVRGRGLQMRRGW